MKPTLQTIDRDLKIIKKLLGIILDKEQIRKSDLDYQKVLRKEASDNFVKKQAEQMEYFNNIYND